MKERMKGREGGSGHILNNPEVKFWMRVIRKDQLTSWVSGRTLEPDALGLNPALAILAV